MTKPSILAHAALGVALIALFSPFAGVAEAASDKIGHKIGKNLVVGKSIKNGAVTGKKVKDGTLTAADLALGTLPGPTRQVVMASCECVSLSAGGVGSFSPFGPDVTGADDEGTTPIPVRLADFLIEVPAQPGSKQVTFSVTVYTMGGGARVVPICAVGGGARSCSGTGTIDLAAGDSFELDVQSGSAGADGAFAQVGYTLTTR